MSIHLIFQVSPDRFSVQGLFQYLGHQIEDLKNGKKYFGGRTFSSLSLSVSLSLFLIYVKSTDRTRKTTWEKLRKSICRF